MAKACLILLCLLVAFAAVTAWRADRREKQTEAAYPPEGQFVTVNGHHVHVVVRGAAKGTAPDVVLIHGASGSTRDMTFSLSGKLEKNYRVIVIDRPGLGYTPRLHRRGETLAEQAALLQGATGALGADKPIVVGQSYGGAVALAWAVHHPESLSALVTLSAASNPWTTPLSRYYKTTSSWWGAFTAVPLISAWVPERVVSQGVAEVFEPQDVPQGYAAYFGPGMTLRRNSMVANARQRANLLSQINAQVPLYKTISVPTEILHGDTDATVGLEIHSRPLSKQIPNSVLTVLPGIGHMPQHVAQDAVVAAVNRAAHRAGLK